jgi:hypothetical protein
VLLAASSSTLLRGRIVDIFGALGNGKGKQKAADESPAKDERLLLVLWVEGLGGLALSTDNTAYEPRCVSFVTLSTWIFLTKLHQLAGRTVA